jgi:hypothetical protein
LSGTLRPRAVVPQTTFWPQCAQTPGLVGACPAAARARAASTRERKMRSFGSRTVTGVTSPPRQHERMPTRPLGAGLAARQLDLKGRLRAMRASRGGPQLECDERATHVVAVTEPASGPTRASCSREVVRGRPTLPPASSMRCARACAAPARSMSRSTSAGAADGPAWTCPSQVRTVRVWPAQRSAVGSWNAWPARVGTAAAAGSGRPGSRQSRRLPRRETPTPLPEHHDLDRTTATTRLATGRPGDVRKRKCSADNTQSTTRGCDTAVVEDERPELRLVLPSREQLITTLGDVEPDPAVEKRA